MPVGKQAVPWWRLGRGKRRRRRGVGLADGPLVYSSRLPGPVGWHRTALPLLHAGLPSLSLAKRKGSSDPGRRSLPTYHVQHSSTHT